MQRSHPAIRRSADSVRVAMAAWKPPVERSEDSWKARFLDSQGNPLPTDGTRIDVKTGEKLGRVSG
jgi:hypothetical protein